MPKISVNKKQQENLKKVNALLIEIKDLNAFLQSKVVLVGIPKQSDSNEDKKLVPSKVISINIKGVDDKPKMLAVSLIKAIREKKVSEIKKLAKANNIEFDSDELKEINMLEKQKEDADPKTQKDEDVQDIQSEDLSEE